MMTLSLVLLTTLTVLEVTVAPDQPLPLAYVDDPLIIEFKADEDITISGALSLTSGERPPINVALDETLLRGGSARWLPVEGLPPLRGNYDVRLTLDEGPDSVEYHQVISRVDRPLPGSVNELVITVNEITPVAYRVLRTLSADSIQTASPKPEDNQEFTFWRVATGANLEVNAAAKRHPYWVVTNPQTQARAKAAQELLRQGNNANVAVVSQSPAELQHFLATPTLSLRADWLLPAAGIAEYQAVARRFGLEKLQWRTRLSGNHDTLTALILALANGAETAHIHIDEIYNGDSFTPRLPELIAFGYRLSGAQYVGPLNVEHPATAHVFRRKDRWIVTAWSNGDPASFLLQTGDALDIQSHDAANNVIPLMDAAEGEVAVALTNQPRYVSGAKGQVIKLAARYRARQAAENMLEIEETEELLTEEALDALKLIAAENTDHLPRREFLLLLQSFPALERSWSRGEIAPHEATAIIGGLAESIRALCTLEEERGEVFIEPYQDRLARCKELQLQYVTGLSGASIAHDRGDWLEEEINRQTEHVRALAAQDRLIEADALAAMAEWRARSLQYASHKMATELTGDRDGDDP